MKRLFYLLWLLMPLALFGQGVGVRSLNGLATNLTVRTGELIDVNAHGATNLWWLTNVFSINSTTSRVDWSQLRGVPAGIADGTDDTVAGAAVAFTNAVIGYGDEYRTNSLSIGTTGTTNIGTIYSDGLVLGDGGLTANVADTTLADVYAENITFSSGITGSGANLTNIPIASIVSPGAIVTNGQSTTITLSNSIYSQAATVTSPSSSELVTAGFVRGLFDGAGITYYVTTNANASFTNAGVVTTNATFFEFNTTQPTYHAIRVYTTPTNNSYMGFVTTTNKFLQLNAGVTVNSTFSVNAGGSGTAGPTVKPEIYVSYDGTNWFGDWSGPYQNIPEGATNLYSWVVANPRYVTTNATGFYVMRAFKVGTQPTPNPSDITFHIGTNATVTTPSHISLPGVTTGAGNAFLAADQYWSGSNYFAGNTTFALPPVGDGSGLTNLNASNLASGTVPDARLSTNALPYVNINLYGAIPNDGLTDQAALKTALAVAATNWSRTVYIPKGVYDIYSSSGGFEIPDGVRILGDDRSGSQLKAWGGGVWTNSFFRAATDGNPNSYSAFTIEKVALLVSEPATNFVFINLTGTRGAIIRDITISGSPTVAAPEIAVLYSDTNAVGGAETCFFSTIENCIILASTNFFFAGGGANDITLHNIVNVNGNAQCVFAFVGTPPTNLRLANNYFSGYNGAAISPATARLPERSVSIRNEFEGYDSTGAGGWTPQGIGVANVNYGWSEFDGAVITPGYGFSVQQYTPLLPDSLDDQYVISGCAVATNTATTVIIEPGAALNRHYATGAASFVLYATNYSSNHISSVAFNTNVPSVFDSRGVLLESWETNASHLFLADVYVDHAGNITNIVDRRVFLPAPTFRSVTVSNSLSIGGDSIDSWDDVTNYFAQVASSGQTNIIGAFSNGLSGVTLYGSNVFQVMTTNATIGFAVGTNGGIYSPGVSSIKSMEFSSSGISMPTDRGVGASGADNYFSTASGVIGRSATDYQVSIDYDNNSSAQQFIVKKDVATFVGGTQLFSVDESGNAVASGQFTGNGAGLSNSVDLIPGSNVTITTNANNRSFTIASTGGDSLWHTNATTGYVTNNNTISAYGLLLGDGGLTANVADTTLADVYAENISATTLAGAGSGITGINPTNINSGTAGISITGNAVSATTASTANAGDSATAFFSTGDLEPALLATNAATASTILRATSATTAEWGIEAAGPTNIFNDGQYVGLTDTNNQRRLYFDGNLTVLKNFDDTILFSASGDDYLRLGWDSLSFIDISNSINGYIWYKGLGGHVFDGDVTFNDAVSFAGGLNIGAATFTNLWILSNQPPAFATNAFVLWNPDNAAPAKAVYYGNDGVPTSTNSFVMGAWQTNFTIAVIPDSQMAANSQPQWFVDSAQFCITSGVSAVIHVGDIVNDSSVQTQWDSAYTNFFEPLKAAGIPVIIASGNHDYDDVDTYVATNLNRRLSNGWFTVTGNAGVEFENNSTNSINSFWTITNGTQRLGVIALEYYARAAAVNWASNIIQTNLDLPIWIVQHMYLNAAGNRSTGAGPGSAENLWANLISNAPNVTAVFCGHISPPMSIVNVVKGGAGQAVTEILTDFQNSTNEPIVRLLRYNEAQAAWVGQCYYASNGLEMNLDTTGGNELLGNGYSFVMPSGISRFVPEPLRSVGITIDGGGSAFTTGVKGYIEVPYPCTVRQVTMLADQVGNCGINVWRTNSTGFPPSTVGKISGAATPVLSNTNWFRDATLTGWTKSLNANDILGFNVESNATITRLTLQLQVQPK